jgi:Protein of unknown function (DUF995)
MQMIVRSLTIIATAASLSACSGMGVFKDSPSADSQIAALPPDTDLMPETPAILSAAEIKTIITGKSWSWASAKNSGTTLYASDGTSLVQVTGRGTTKGKWQVQDGQLCESFAPAKFIPKGVPMTCQPFSGTAGNYKLGPASFNLAS